jgi:hypothetical protein
MNLKDLKPLNEDEQAVVTTLQQRGKLGKVTLKVGYHQQGRFTTAIVSDEEGNLYTGVSRLDPSDRKRANNDLGKRIAFSKALGAPARTL